jgi:hypothetical protein
MHEYWRRWIATYPILESWSGSGWPDAVELLAREAWKIARARDEAGVLPQALRARLKELGVSGDLIDALSDEVGAGVRFGALLGFALARTYPGCSEELNAWLEQAIDYVGASLASSYTSEDYPSPG